MSKRVIIFDIDNSAARYSGWRPGSASSAAPSWLHEGKMGLQRNVTRWATAMATVTATAVAKAELS
jgi:hypothetical protein